MAGETVLAKLAVQIAANTSAFDKSLKSTEGNFKKFTGGITKAAGGLLAGVAVGALAKDIVDITARFENFQAVLSNTLGSDSAAQQALQQIKDFAAATPFSVEQLTSAFVKLANQGFKPTTEEMIALGDLASSTGKSFDQLAEALIDAQVGEFERLKEFGVRARKEGENVKFTFKGVETVVKNSSEAIQGYVLSLGKAQGVSGAMEKQSKTLGGAISNLGDSWDGLMVAFGSGQSGPLRAVITTLSEFINTIAMSFKSVEQIKKEVQDKSIVKAQTDAVEEFKTTFLKNYKDISEGAERYNRFLQVTIDGLKREYILATDEQRKSLEFQIRSLEAQQQAVKDYAIEVQKGTEAQKQANKQNKKATEVKPNGLIPQLQNQIKLLQVEIDKSFDPAAISDFNRQIDVLQSKIKEIENLSNIDLVGKIGISSLNFREFTAKFDEASKLTKEKVTAFASGVQADVAKLRQNTMTAAQQMIDIGPMIANGIADVAASLGEAIASQDFSNFGSNILEAVASFAQQLGAQLIALGVAEVALKAAAGNPVALIVAGAALVAAGAAVKGSLKKQGGVISGSGGGGSGGGSPIQSSSVNKFDTGGNQITLGGQFKIEGRDLVLAINNENIRKSRQG